jgi:PAS domain S-box-containing protein
MNALQLQSLNEELATTNEELRASYEELQASNEELLQARVALEQLNGQLEERVALRTQQLKLAQQQAQKQQRDIYSLFMQAPAGIALLEGPDLVYRMANQTYYQILGRNEQILGKPGRVAFAEGVEQGIWDLLDSVYASGKPFIGKEYRAFIDMEGTGALSEQYYDFVFQPVRGESGQVIGILITALNVTHQVEARKAVLEREAYFRQMADSVPVMIWVTGADGNCTYLNKPWYEYTGQGEQEALGLGWLAATHPEDKGRSEQAFLEANKQQAPFSLRYRLKHQDGSYRWFLDKGEPKFDAQSEFTGYVGVVIDVHKQYLAEERLQLSVKAGRVGLWEWDVARDRATYSDLLLELFGLDKKQYQGEFASAYQVYQSVIHPADWEKVDAAVEKAFANQEKEFYVEFRVERPSGETVWIAERGEVFYQDQMPLRMNGTCIDITSRKQAEQEIEQLAQKLVALNQELAASNEELRAANEELGQTNQQLSSINADLDNFVYTASHDLKAPILNIEGLIKTLERQTSREAFTSKNVEQIYELLYGSVERFKTTIRDLTEVTHISKESVEDVSSIPIAEVLYEVLQDLSPQIEEAGASVEQKLDCPAVVFSRKNLKSLLYNLISNAVKYRSSRSVPLVRITCTTQEDYLVLSVQDNGLGFDMRQQDKLFALFKRLHNHVEGTGIGLYIVKKMLDNAGGSIEVESQQGVGSTFRVYLKR